MLANLNQTRWEEELSKVTQDAARRGKWASILVGGCCKTTPEDIARLREQISEYNKLQEWDAKRRDNGID